ncbi:zinc transporter ZntB [Pseudaestuariivita rosea]|uniref:zinc transporter ZntB n=1 Tax=Pseudaestuariivita rosea TaxID=2763263 RepID=UPI001ABB85DC|nr:zinc transporter ZntB [Pseudaestuariivita rosea]
MAKAPFWLHLKADAPDTRDWMMTHLPFVSPYATEALLAAETRPRAKVTDDALLVILRGVNTNQGQDPDDMVSVRLWISAQGVVSLALRRLSSIEELSQAVEKGRGPDTPGAFLHALIEKIGHYIERFLRDLDDETDAIENAILDKPDSVLRLRIAEARRQVVTFRRYIAPQRDAVSDILRAGLPFISEADRRSLSESNDRLIRTIEDLDAIRERLQVVKDELANVLADRLNRNLYLLSIISAIFLPLGFLTGLMGINLGGMPGASAASAFWIFTGALIVLAVIQVIIFRWRRWF